MQAALDHWSARRSTAVPPELIGRVAPARTEGINCRGVFRFPIDEVRRSPHAVRRSYRHSVAPRPLRETVLLLTGRYQAPSNSFRRGSSYPMASAAGCSSWPGRRYAFSFGRHSSPTTCTPRRPACVHQRGAEHARVPRYSEGRRIVPGRSRPSSSRIARPCGPPFPARRATWSTSSSPAEEGLTLHLSPGISCSRDEVPSPPRHRDARGRELGEFNGEPDHVDLLLRIHPEALGLETTSRSSRLTMARSCGGISAARCSGAGPTGWPPVAPSAPRQRRPTMRRHEAGVLLDADRPDLVDAGLAVGVEDEPEDP